MTEALAAFRRGDLNRARALTLAELESRAEGAADAEHLAGLIDCRLGDLASGVQHLQAALAAEPANPAYRVMLARALLDAGRPQEALDHAVAPRETSAAAIALWHVRAEAAQAVGDFAAAAAAWKVTCAARPGDWRCHAARGDVLTQTEDWAAAADAFHQAFELKPDEHALRRKFAAALARAGRFQDSAEQLALWADNSPDDPAVRISLARLLADLGRFEESVAQINRAAALTGATPFVESGEGLIQIAAATGDVDVQLLKELARLLERINRTEALRRLLNDAEARGVGRDRLGFAAAALALRDGDAAAARHLLLAQNPAEDPVRWHALMTRIADQLGDSETAFASAEAMNRSSYDYHRWRERSTTYLEWVRGLAPLMTEEWASGLRSAPPDGRRDPCFLVGFPRSGTTLLDTFLLGHPDVAVLEEVPVLNEAVKLLGAMAGLPQRSVEELEQARQAYFSELDRHLDPAFAGLVIDKMPLNMLALPYIRCLFPNAPVIVAQRHPCDAVLSCFLQGFAPNDAMACFLDLQDSANFYDAAMTVFCTARDMLPLRIHTLVYEDLVAAPEQALRPLIDFVGLEWDRDLLDHRSTAVARGAIGTPSYDQVAQALSKAPIGRWQRYEAQLASVLPTLLPWAQRLGY